jgi:hypothetical protein
VQQSRVSGQALLTAVDVKLGAVKAVATVKPINTNRSLFM